MATSNAKHEPAMDARKSLSYRVSANRWTHLRKEAIERGVSVQQLIDVALDEYLKAPSASAKTRKKEK